MNETALALVFTLACFGISETTYLIRKRKASEKPFCPVGDRCELVLGSKYNKILFLHNDIAGLLFYFAIAIIAGSLVVSTPFDPSVSLLLKTMVIAGSLVSVYFTVLQWKIIKAWCFWCLMSALTIWTMLLILTIESLR